ncbi:cysteine hydrolase family protein [Phaeobacter sp. HF9A]|uniref:cysteine hydrolase family protein n=1 Tax=Phaeobacter sp. HF9A TaxID=2721561 RepID=UPI00143203FB|nr:cysteine hydrolase [Phaeobacter sp. HF9A]NIZ14948.1 cysteine hydrolase [Phaeobacter sp. HF9A]
MIFAYIVGAAVLGAFLVLFYAAWRIGVVSRGTKIGARDKTALLLVDLQTVFWDSGPYDEAAKSAAQEVILDEIKAAKAQGLPVVAVRQEWSLPSSKLLARLFMKGQAIEGSAGTEIAAPFAGLADHVVVKRVQDAFDTGELDRLLAELNVGRLRILGLDFNYCVHKTALAARNRGYAVTVLKGGSLAAGATARAEQRMADSGAILQ